MGVVLAGAAALGAYEVGVMWHVLEEVSRDIGVSTMPAVVSGTSAGGINAAALAAYADEPHVGIKQVRDAWAELRLAEAVRPSSVELLSMFLDVVGTPAALRRALHALAIRGALLDPTPIAHQIAKAPLERIPDHLRSGTLRGVAVAATRVSNGDAVVFHDGVQVKPWSPRELVTPVATELSLEHVLASAAIPLLFPPVRIGEELYCDGGLRQLVPLSPAIHLGATRLLVVNPLPAARPVPERAHKVILTSPLYLAGKALNALFADRVEVDLARLEHTNAILRAGRTFNQVRVMAEPTRSRIVHVALELFLRKGYGSTSIADILASANVNSGSLYHFFPSKQDVLLAVLDTYHRGIDRMLLEPAWRGTQDPLDKVFALLAAYRRMLVDTECCYGCPIGSLALELHEPDPPVRERLAANFEAWTDAVRRQLQAASAELGARIDQRGVAELVLVVMEGAVMLARTHRDVAYFDRAVGELRRYFDLLLGRDGARTVRTAAPTNRSTTKTAKLATPKTAKLATPKTAKLAKTRTRRK